jgi:hypothetical protein
MPFITTTAPEHTDSDSSGTLLLETSATCQAEA